MDANNKTLYSGQESTIETKLLIQPITQSHVGNPSQFNRMKSNHSKRKGFKLSLSVAVGFTTFAGFVVILCCKETLFLNNSNSKVSTVSKGNHSTSHITKPVTTENHKYSRPKPSYNKFDYMAFINNEFEDSSGVCGGTFILEDYILTSARCLYKVVSYTVYLGMVATSQLDASMILPINKTIIHKFYNSTDFKNNIALIKLNKYVSPEELVGRVFRRIRKSEVFNELSCTIPGRGSLNNNSTSDKIISKNVTIINMQNDFPTDPSRMFAVSDRGPRDKDFGGPLICDFEQTAIYSDYDSNSHRYVFTNINYYCEWIAENTGKSIC